MGTIKRFEDIRAWRSARELVKVVYQASQKQQFAKDFALKDQICRAAGSVMHNIAEGFDSGSDAEFLRFLGYARRSTSEVQSQLYTALDLNYISDTEFEAIYELAHKIKLEVNAFIAYLSKSISSKKTRETISPYIASTNGIHLDDLLTTPDQLDESDQSDQSDYS
jgi:four helix bundle protein